MKMVKLDEPKAFLLDLDGTLISNKRPLPGARKLLEMVEGRFVVVSNDAEHTPLELSLHLGEMGLRVDVDRIKLAGMTALETIAKERPGARLMLLGSAALEKAAQNLGLIVSNIEPDVVLVARDRHFSYEKLARAANALRQSAELIVANPDLVHPGPHSTIVPETGALLAAILACTGAKDYRVVGKPEPGLYLSALACLGSRPENAVMVGDNATTDGAGAERLGIRFWHVSDGLVEILSAVGLGDTSFACAKSKTSAA